MGRSWDRDRKFLVDLGAFGLLLALLSVLYQLGTFNSLLRIVGQYVASKVLAVPVTVGSARITLDGQLELYECVIHCAVDQADMWDQPYLVSVKRIRVACDPQSLFTKTFRFSEFCIDSITIRVQKKDGVVNFEALGGPKNETDEEIAQAGAVANGKEMVTMTQQKENTELYQVQSTTTTPSDSQMAITAPSQQIVATTTTTTTTTKESNTSLFSGLFGSLKAGAEQLKNEVRCTHTVAPTEYACNELCLCHTYTQTYF